MSEKLGWTFKSGNLMANRAQEGFFERLGSVIGEKAFVRRHGCKFSLTNSTFLMAIKKAWFLQYVNPPKKLSATPCPQRRGKKVHSKDHFHADVSQQEVSSKNQSLP